MTWRSRVRSPAVRALSFLAVGLLLILSLFGSYRATTMPDQREVSVPVVQYTHQGQFDYRVHLKPNSLFESTELGPGQVYFVRLVDDVRMTYSYQLVTDSVPEEQEFTYQVTALLGTDGLWERSFALVPPTTTDGDFTVSFVLPIPQFLELIDAVREETRAATGFPELTVRARVQPEVSTAHGSITEPFEQTLRFTFNDETITVADGLQATEQGSIDEAEFVPTPGLDRLRAASIAGVLVSLALLSVLGWDYVQYKREISPADRELERAKKQLNGLLVRADRLPSQRTDQTVIQLSALSDLLDMAEETYQPVVYTRQNGAVTYVVIANSGAVRYEYSSDNDAAAAETQQNRHSASALSDEPTDVAEVVDV